MVNTIRRLLAAELRDVYGPDVFDLAIMRVIVDVLAERLAAGLEAV